jgi:hypothetical protein
VRRLQQQYQRISERHRALLPAYPEKVRALLRAVEANALFLDQFIVDADTVFGPEDVYAEVSTHSAHSHAATRDAHSHDSAHSHAHGARSLAPTYDAHSPVPPHDAHDAHSHHPCAIGSAPSLSISAPPEQTSTPLASSAFTSQTTEHIPALTPAQEEEKSPLDGIAFRVPQDDRLQPTASDMSKVRCDESVSLQVL